MPDAARLTGALLVTFSLGIAGQPFAIAALRRRGVLDVPSARSLHASPVPRGGGAVVVAAALIGLGISGGDWAVLLGMASFAAIGLAEDLHGVSIRGRLLSQLLCGVGTGLVAAASWPTTRGVPDLILVALLLGLLVSFANAFNFMDGINGISAGTATAASGAYALVGLQLRSYPLAASALCVAVASLSFVPWNAGRARVFLGDSGSYGLGAGLACVAGLALATGATVEAAVAPLLLYLADVSLTLLRRIRTGHPWHEPHRTHVYQRLVTGGWPHGRAAALVTIATAANGLLGVGSMVVAWPWRALLVAGTVMVTTLYVRTPSLLVSRKAGRDRPGAP